jgi:ribosomal protein S18 acetylase RimI-like enzyme
MRWADAVIVDAFPDGRFWTTVLAVRAARVLSKPSIVVVRGQAWPGFADEHPRRVRATLPWATRVLAPSAEVRRDLPRIDCTIDDQPSVALGFEPAAVAAGWEATLASCGVVRRAERTNGCGPLGIGDLDDVVAIHAEAFPDSAMTKLGASVLRRYYLWQFIGPHPAPVALGAWRDGQLVGMLFGGRRRRAVAGFVRRYAVSVAGALVARPGATRALAAPKVLAVARALRRSPSARRAPTSVVEADPVTPGSPPSVPYERSFGVLSVAVRSAARGTGAAVELMDAAERAARADGLAQMHLTVQVGNERAIAFYEKLGWERQVSNGAWQGAMVKALVAPA